MAEPLSYVIVGNGIAGVTAAETVRQEQPAAEITIVAETPTPACYRPALKDYLAGRVSEEALFARRPGFYADKGLRFLLDRVVAIDAAQHQLVLRRGQSIGYDRLLLATGGRARRLTCPGNDLAGVLTLRSITDYQAAMRFLKIARRVVVYGGGPLALETVETLRQRGMPVTHLLRRRQLWADTLDRTASELILHQEREAGVEVRVEDEISEIIGRQGRIMGIITRNGARIPCDLLITAIGSEPVIDFIQSSSIACERGITVDHAMRTSAADVYAAGDVAETLDPLTGRMRILGQWYPAMQQGRAAAYSMLGMLDALRLRHAATYSSAYLRPINTYSLFGFDIAAIGLTQVSAPVYKEVVADIKKHIYSKAILKNGVPVGMLSFDSRRDMLAIKRAIDHGVDLTAVASCLFERDFKLQTWLDAQKVPAPVLAVRKASTNVAQLVTTTPARSFRSQFAPSTPLLEWHAEDEDTGRTLPMELPANNNPYNLHIIPSAAFLAPILPARTAQTLVASDDIDHTPTIMLNEQDPDMTVAPAHTHTPISQAESLTIGREAACKLVINHQSISRQHAAITCANGTYLLRDLGSRNGTFINETRLAPDRDYPLKPRDHIRIGNLLTYQFLLRPVVPGV
ncbi:MAG TPA: FAD-dependent oxidoreductase [Ktedonobacteraceae bacterium]|nr:FAD-dependent oxidoreductase [Ktedonobacteraceae bacterium]